VCKVRLAGQNCPMECHYLDILIIDTLNEKKTRCDERDRVRRGYVATSGDL
jgi:hypothetical protein